MDDPVRRQKYRSCSIRPDARSCRLLRQPRLGPLSMGRRALAQTLPARVDAAALRQRIEALSMFGGLQAARCRWCQPFAYSDADVAGRRYMIDLCGQQD